MELNVDAVSDRAGFMLCLKNLPEIVRRKNHGVFLVGTVFGRIPNIEQVGAERQMRPVFFDKPERQQTDALRLLNPFYKVSRSEFFPLRGEFLRRRESRSEQDSETQPDYGNETTIHFFSPPNVRILAPGRGFVMLKSMEEDFSGTGTLACAPTIHPSEGLRVHQRSPRLCVIFCLPPSWPTTEQFAKLFPRYSVPTRAATGFSSSIS